MLASEKSNKCCICIIKETNNLRQEKLGKITPNVRQR